MARSACATVAAGGAPSHWPFQLFRSTIPIDDRGGIAVATCPSSLDILRSIHSDNVESIRFMDERQASFRFGPGHEHGAILVTLRGE
jgi:hypothetical protein